MPSPDPDGEWVKVESNGAVYDIYIGRSEDLPELEELLAPPKRGR